MHPTVADFDAIFTLVLLRGLEFNLLQMTASLVESFHADFLSSDSRSQCASDAPASYVLCAKSRISDGGDFAWRTSSYISKNSWRLASYLAAAGRTGQVAYPGGSGAVYA